MNSDHPSPILVHFSPENWGTVERFIRFCATTYRFKWQVQKRLSGILGNYSKASRITQLIRDLTPLIEQDEKELQAKGHSSSRRSKELAAIVEAAFCSLYSTLDCFRHVFVAIYSNHRGMKESTRGLFQNGHENKLDERIPEPIRKEFLESKLWFDKLREYRDEMTHADVGGCLRKDCDGPLTYMHGGLGTRNQSLIIEDVVSVIEQFAVDINSFLGRVFAEINKTLKDEETVQLCGIFNFRFHERFVKPSEAVDFHGGRCKSLEWFDAAGNPECPLKNACGAYPKAKSLSNTKQP